MKHGFSPSRAHRPRTLGTLLAGVLACAAPLVAAESPKPAAPTATWDDIRPLLASHCYKCHGGQDIKAGIDLTQFEDAAQVGDHYDMWQDVFDAVDFGDMPPAEEKQFSEAERAALLTWLDGAMKQAATSNAGDPGLVTMRRLTNAEYDYTIRDLTGHDYQLAGSFLPDAGGGEGFSNVGDLLFTSPQQLDNYLAAARKLSDHATVLPGTGITFHEQRIGLRGPEQLKTQASKALYVWYQQQARPYIPKDGEDLREADYLLACWEYKHRKVTGATSLDELAKKHDLFAPFLHNWWEFLNSDNPKSRFLDLTRQPWRALRAPDEKAPNQVPPAVREQCDAIEAQRKSWYTAKGWASVQRRQQDVTALRAYTKTVNVGKARTLYLGMNDAGDGNAGDYSTASDLRFRRAGQKKWEPYVPWLRDRLTADEKALENAKDDKAKTQIVQRVDAAKQVLSQFGKHPLKKEIDADTLASKAPVVFKLPLPDEVVQFKATFRLDYKTPEADQATVQWKISPNPLPKLGTIWHGTLILWKRSTPAHRTTMREYNRMRIVFPDTYDRRLDVVTDNYRRNGKGPGVYYLSDAQLMSIVSPDQQAYAKAMLTDWEFVKRSKLPKKLEQEWDGHLHRHLLAFASQAWRRPLRSEERSKLGNVYDLARKQGLDRESAAREVLVRILASPHFLYKVEQADEPGSEHRVSSWELATRLSYFLWSSMPDEKLRQAARNGSLFEPEVLDQQVTRMLRDARAEALAVEFAGQWLEYHGFDKHDTVDQGKFPAFTPALREDLYREAVTFVTHIIREDRPVREIIQADYTFLNQRLAEHYGIEGVEGGAFRKVNVASHHRGGILGMGSILTATSYPHRTSPVLRGHWLLKSVLGSPTPPPPPDVPELEETGDKPATLRQRLEQHRADPACASCHDKIDPLGFSLESFDAIGRRRKADASGLPIDHTGRIKDGPSFADIDGLRKYLATRNDEFMELFCRKLVGYALGRSVLPTDAGLIEEMQASLEANEGRFSAAVRTLVNSRQFQFRKNQ